MSVLHDFAEFFKSRKVPVRTWYEDGVGKWAFRVTVEGQDFVCCARKSRPANGTTSIMKRVAGRAQTSDAYIALRLPDDRIHVFDPVAVLSEARKDDVAEDDRRERGEEWVEVPTRLACDFEEWYDGHAEPATYHDVTAF
jgi:hypothetical protein